jgi:hypothetical protein
MTQSALIAMTVGLVVSLVIVLGRHSSTWEHYVSEFVGLFAGISSFALTKMYLHVYP